MKVKFSKWHRSGTHFWGEMLALFWARKYASSILPGGKRYEAQQNLNTQNPVSLRFLIF